VWLYIPPACCPSAPASQGSNSESGSPVPEPELFVMSSGKGMLRPLSWRGFRTRPWTTLLSGLSLPRSTADLGAEKWISSLEDTPASPSASRGRCKEETTPGTSGPTSSGSSEKCRHLLASLRTSRTTSTSASEKYAKAFGKWVSGLKREYTARQKSAPRTSGSASSSSPAGKEPWPTPTAQDSRGSGAAGYQTKTRNPGTTLTDRAVRMWPTPMSRDGKGGADWSKRQRNGKPRAESAMTLPDAAKMWPTPSATPYGSNRGGGAGRVGPVRHSLQALARQGSGKGCPTVLNPRFVEVLQGLPPGWTDCESSATASYRRWLRLHGETCGER